MHALDFVDKTAHFAPHIIFIMMMQNVHIRFALSLDRELLLGLIAKHAAQDLT